MPIKVALVEDNALLRKRFAQQLAFFNDLKLVGSYATGEAALQALEKSRPSRLPDIILMDIELPKMSGIETTIAIKEQYPGTDILIITVFEDEEKVFQSIQAGASGYLLKGDPSDRIVDAIRELHRGGAPMSQSIARMVLSFTRSHLIEAGTSKPIAALPSAPADFELSSRERELLEGLVQGETYTSFAKKLCISPHTVKTHIKNIYKKLHVHSRATAVRIALEKKLISS